jgi:hypothetical protein
MSHDCQCRGTAAGQYLPEDKILQLVSYFLYVSTDSTAMIVFERSKTEPVSSREKENSDQLRGKAGEDDQHGRRVNLGMYERGLTHDLHFVS